MKCWFVSRKRLAKKITELKNREDNRPFLRIKITGGGCNGLSYKMRFIAEGKKTIF